jgi:asparagine synthase (glutamine-hydrolysing)
MRVSESWQEIREMGISSALFRAGWEIRMRTGLMALQRPRVPELDTAASRSWATRLPFAEARNVSAAVRDRISQSDIDRLSHLATEASRGRILCFGRWHADFGDPIDWNLDPSDRVVWRSDLHWSRSLASANGADIKFTWEAGRFPHAYHITRAAAFDQDRSAVFAEALSRQIADFIAAAPFGQGVHWASSQEVVIRLIAWLFASQALLVEQQASARLVEAIGRSLAEMATHVEHHLAYAERSVFNNHLLLEGLGLLIAGQLLQEIPDAQRWFKMGVGILDEQADKQVYKDGAYIQQSHNYHRAALQGFLVALMFARNSKQSAPESWNGAVDRSLTFLLAHQNPSDGRLPNYGFNDGALPLILSTCDFSDFRPVLQAASLAVRGERVYEPGPWDEEAAWLLGPATLKSPLRPSSHESVSFARTGYHVIRGVDASNFATFRCGSINDRFSQIDMLNVDLWWRGQNVVVDGGSYSYNGPAKWHNHFTRTASHNTIEIDGLDQMLHYRKFKCLYWTRARLHQFEDRGPFALVAGEHYGYQRHAGGCIHRRSMLFVKDSVWVVVDQLTGSGEHNLRLQWLMGDFPCESHSTGTATLDTPEGLFTMKVMDSFGNPIEIDMVRGADNPPRGWLSRYYGEKVPVASIAATVTCELPFRFITILGEGDPQVSMNDGTWTIDASKSPFNFVISDGLIVPDPAGEQAVAQA